MAHAPSKPSDTLARAIFSALASAGAIEAAATPSDAAAAAAATHRTLSTTVLAEHLDHPAVPGLGARIVHLIFTCSAKASTPRTTDAPSLTLADFVRGLEACCAGSSEQRLALLFDALAVDERSDTDALAALLARAYALETGRDAAPTG